VILGQMADGGLFSFYSDAPFWPEKNAMKTKVIIITPRFFYKRDHEELRATPVL
jgi:hypothetical protein